MPEPQGDIVTKITHRTIKANGINIHIAEAGDGPLVLMLHGFPELWYSWRHQLPALAEAGYHAVAADIRGYGGSDAPYEIEAYSMKNMVADAVGILDALGEESAVIVGHDWGAPMAAHFALLYPERVRAVGLLSVPYVPRSVAPPLQMLKQIFQNNFFYILYFQEPGVAEEELESDVRRSLRVFMYAASGDGPRGRGLMNKPKDARLLDGMPEPDRLPAWLSEEDLDYYTASFERTGFRGALNRYRCMDVDWEQLPQLAGAELKQPALYISGEWDPVFVFTRMEAMKTHLPNLRKTVILERCGHWTQQEAPAEVNAEIIGFLKDLDA
jgi:pimeloyl-ACP methyl ester carboxylesterase